MNNFLLFLLFLHSFINYWFVIIRRKREPEENNWEQVRHIINENRSLVIRTQENFFPFLFFLFCFQWKKPMTPIQEN